jgi:hypothetical protein
MAKINANIDSKMAKVNANIDSKMAKINIMVRQMPRPARVSLPV